VHIPHSAERLLAFAASNGDTAAMQAMRLKALGGNAAATTPSNNTLPFPVQLPVQAVEQGLAESQAAAAR
jgi:hypothetical protein